MSKKNIYIYSKLRKNFGRELLFQTVPAQMLDSISSSRAEQKKYILRNPIHKDVQAIIPQSTHEVNTKHLVVREQGVNHKEGGWPRDVQPSNEEHVTRHRRRVMHEENYIHTVMSLTPAMNHYIDQNNAIEMYQTYFTEIKPQAPVEKYNIRICNQFRDKLHRPVSCIAWTQEKKSKIAVAYCNKNIGLDTTGLNFSNDCYLWDIRRHNAPADSLQPSKPCWQLACSPGSPDVLVAGLEDGTVCLFDVRASKTALSTSSTYHSHRDPVTALQYMQTRTNSEFFTGSPDGQCLWWDTRNLSEPTEKIIMSCRHQRHVEPDLGNAEAVSSLQYDRGLPTKFLCGTDSGLVINVNRLGKDHSEVIASYWDAHSGPVRAVQRSPCTLRMFITCGDWFVRVWSEEVRTAPIIVNGPYQRQIMDVAWAPLRYSCFMAVSADGVFNYWDLLRKYREPVATKKVSEYELTHVAPHVDGKIIATADNNGSIFLIELPDGMTVPGANDKHLMQEVYERETKREHILDNRVKEIRLKARQEEEAAAAAAAAAETGEPEEEDEEQAEKDIEEEYWKIVGQEQSKMEDFY